MRVENGYIIWLKGENKVLSPHFKTAEFTCNCIFKGCDEQRLSGELLNRLERLRVAFGKPIDITSGYRCKAYQDHLRASGHETAKGVSSHELGNAVDIRPLHLKDLPDLCFVVPKEFSSIGTARTFIHVDIRPGIRRWSYR